MIRRISQNELETLSKGKPIQCGDFLIKASQSIQRQCRIILSSKVYSRYIPVIEVDMFMPVLYLTTNKSYREKVKKQRKSQAFI